MNRRQFFQAAVAAASVSRIVAQDDVPNWGGNVIDVHLHPRQQAGGEWTHMQGCGVTHAVLLTNSRAVPHAKEEIANRPDRFKLFVSVNAAAPDAMEQLRGFVKDGAIGFGEMKSPLKADGPEMMKVYALAGELGVPVTIHFGDVPQFAGDSSYNEGITRFGPVIKANPKTTFFGHADSFWANVSAEKQDTAYPSGKIKPGGLSDKWLTEFPNLYGDMSANSCRNALGRDPEFMGKFLERHQDKLMFGSDCSCQDGRGKGQGSQAPLIKGKCVARETLTAVKGMSSPAIFRKIAWGNAARLLKF